MASMRQIKANRKNAQKSTGPQTVEGKVISRSNAYRHGLASEGVVLDEEMQQDIASETEAWRGHFHIVDKHDEWNFSEMIVNNVKYRRALREESFLSAYYIDRATFMWEADRELEADEIAANLSIHPMLVVGRLKNFAPGCDWLITRWKQLLGVLESGDSWDDAQRATMLDLAGIPHEMRYGDDDSGTKPGCPETMQFVREQIADLEGFKKNGLIEFEKTEQAGAEAGFPLKIPRPLAKIQRYLREFLRGFRTAFRNLRCAGRCNIPSAAATPLKTSQPVVACRPVSPVRVSLPPEVVDPRMAMMPAGEPRNHVVEAATVPAPTPAPTPARRENRKSRRARMKQENRR